MIHRPILKMKENNRNNSQNKGKMEKIIVIIHRFLAVILITLRENVIPGIKTSYLAKETSADGYLIKITVFLNNHHFLRRILLFRQSNPWNSNNNLLVQEAFKNPSASKQFSNITSIFSKFNKTIYLFPSTAIRNWTT